jgi:hypothetical protein
VLDTRSLGGIGDGLALGDLRCCIHRLEEVCDREDAIGTLEDGPKGLGSVQVGLSLSVRLVYKSFWSFHTETTSAPSSLSFCADSLVVSRVTALTWYLAAVLGSARMVFTTEPPCLPVAPKTTMICLAMVVVAGVEVEKLFWLLALWKVLLWAGCLIWRSWRSYRAAFEGFHCERVRDDCSARWSEHACAQFFALLRGVREAPLQMSAIFASWWRPTAGCPDWLPLHGGTHLAGKLCSRVRVP